MEKDIYTIELGESIRMGEYHVMRVPAGWLFRFKFGHTMMFVPYSEEFIH